MMVDRIISTAGIKSFFMILSPMILSKTAPIKLFAEIRVMNRSFVTIFEYKNYVSAPLQRMIKKFSVDVIEFETVETSI